MSTKTISIPAPLVPAAAPASAAETAGAPSIEHVRRRTVSNTGTETGGALDPVNRRPPRFPYGSAKAPIWRREWIDLAVCGLSVFGAILDETDIDMQLALSRAGQELPNSSLPDVR